LVILVVSILEMSLFLYTYAALTGAAKEGVRYAIVHGSSSSSVQPNCGTAMSTGASTTVLTYASASLHKLTNGNVSVNCPNGNSPGSLVTVGVTYPFQPLFLTNWATVTISATSVGRIQF
jgi:Flp pilus assembly protein TadG